VGRVVIVSYIVAKGDDRSVKILKCVLNSLYHSGSLPIRFDAPSRPLKFDAFRMDDVQRTLGRADGVRDSTVLHRSG